MAVQPQTQSQTGFTDAILDEIEQLVEVNSSTLLTAEKGLRESVKLSHAIKRMREIVSLGLVESEIMALMNTSLGFCTDRPNDRNPQPYEAAVVRDCLIEALLRGARVTGNEFNIIGKRCYLTKPYFVRKVNEFPGISDVRVTPGVPEMRVDREGRGGALQPFVVSWMLNGERFMEERLEQGAKGQPGYRDERIPVKINRGMGADAIAGKAERKILKRVYERLTGATSPIPDGEVGDAEGLDLSNNGKKGREVGTLMPEAFAPSESSNRGHEDTGLESLPEKRDLEPPAVQPEPAKKPEEPQRRAIETPAEPGKQEELFVCSECNLAFGSASHLENHNRIAHPEGDPAVIEQKRDRVRALVLKAADMENADLTKVTAQQRDRVFAIFDKITDGAARSSRDIPAGQLDDAIERAEALLDYPEQDSPEGLF